ncbi:MAG: class I SAM-dependent methyltransferase [Steroidobacteraceae bacterium]
MNIERCFRPTHDERARQKMISMLRKHAIIDMRQDLRMDYEQRIAPTIADKVNEPSQWRAIRHAMESEPSYRFYSSIRYNAQEMCYQSVQPAVERGLGEMIEMARQLAKSPPAGSSLRLNPHLQVPRYVSALDVHLAPGCFHSEFTADDVAQGAVIAQGGKVFTGQHPYRKRPGVVGESVANWLGEKYPGFKPRRILDLGTTSGKNLLPYHAVFPQAELYGIDVGAPVLRYGLALAAAEGVPVHFSQQNAEHTDFPDGFFDLIVSSFFFHEVALKSTRQILVECRRLLSAGGAMVHMELPNEAAVSSYENFFWNWDTENNNEPHYTVFREQLPQELCTAAGFPADRCFAHTIADYATAGVERFAKIARGELAAPGHGSGGWFVFGVAPAPTTQLRPSDLAR